MLRFTLVVSLALHSVSTFAMEIYALPAESKGDVSYLVVDPTFGDGIAVSSLSDQEGLCKALGFERAAFGSAVVDGKQFGPAVLIDPTGALTGAALVSPGDGLRIGQMVCVNQVGKPTFETAYVKKPRHQMSNVPFDTKSDQNGICKLQGYDASAIGAATVDGTYRGPMVTVDANGSVIGGSVAVDGAGVNIDALVCSKAVGPTK